MQRLFICLIVAATLTTGCKKSGTTPSLTTATLPSNLYILGQTGAHIVYWNNGKTVPVDTLAVAGGTTFEQTGIAVSGNNVYVSGTAANSAIGLKAVCWSNGTRAYLTAYPGSATSGITAQGSDVYVAGLTGAPSRDSAVYWKNGTLVALAPYSYGNTLQIQTLGSDLYVLGTVGTDTSVYWKNGPVVTSMSRVGSRRHRT